MNGTSWTAFGEAARRDPHVDPDRCDLCGEGAADLTARVRLPEETAVLGLCGGCGDHLADAGRSEDTGPGDVVTGP